MPTTITLAPTTQSIGILSDSHGFLDKRIIDSLKNVDVILHAGDIMDKTVIEKLKSINPNVFFVTGNNDSETVWPKKDAAMVNAIPESLIFTIGSEKIGMIHGHQFGWGTPDHKQIRDTFNDCRIAIYGHTHRQTIDTSAKPWVINPGASGKIRTRGGVSCLIVTLNSDNWDIQTIKFVD